MICKSHGKHRNHRKEGFMSDDYIKAVSVMIQRKMNDKVKAVFKRLEKQFNKKKL